MIIERNVVPSAQRVFIPSSKMSSQKKSDRVSSIFNEGLAYTRALASARKGTVINWERKIEDLKKKTMRTQCVKFE
jgi:hypothetical protein